MIEARRRLATKQTEKSLPIALQLLLAHAVDAAHLLQSYRLLFRHLIEGLVVEDNVGRNALLPGDFCAELAQGIEQPLVAGLYGRLFLPFFRLFFPGFLLPQLQSRFTAQQRPALSVQAQGAEAT